MPWLLRIRGLPVLSAEKTVLNILGAERVKRVEIRHETNGEGYPMDRIIVIYCALQPPSIGEMADAAEALWTQYLDNLDPAIPVTTFWSTEDAALGLLSR